MLHFAYGSNMDRAAMGRRCPGASALGLAWLTDWRFIVTRNGYASVVPAAGEVVHGILWRLTPRDLAAVNAYESLDSGLYGRRMLPVRHAGGRLQALVYVARERRIGRPKPGYQDLVVAAARLEFSAGLRARSRTLVGVAACARALAGAAIEPGGAA